MKISSFLPVSKQNTPDSPPWFEKAVKPFNEHLKTLTEFASKRVNIEHNLDMEQRTVKLTHGVATDFNVNVKDRVTGVIILASPRRVENPVFSRQSDKMARVTVFFLPTDPGEAVELTLLFFGG